MKCRKLFASLLAAVALVAVGCVEEEKDSDIPSLKVSGTELALPQQGGSQTFQVTSNRPWKIENSTDWLAFDPSNGPASDSPVTVTVTALSNAGHDRTGSVKVSMDFDYKTIAVNQGGELGPDASTTPVGEGTLEDPYNVIAAIDYVKSLGPDVESSSVIYVKGVVSEVKMTYEASGTYGNANFYITGNGSTDAPKFYCFQTLYLGNKKWTSGQEDIKVGDEVVVCGKVINYKGDTPETVGKGGSYLYSLNGESQGGGGGETDYDQCEEKTVAQFIEAADENTYYKLTGTVSRFSAQFCSFDLTDGSGTIYVYSVDNKADWVDKISNGGTVVLAGKYLYYSSKSQHEVVNAQILSFTEGGGGGDEPSEAETVTVAEFIAAAESFTQPYQLTGTIGGSINTTYGNFDLTDETGTVYVYGLTKTNLGYGAQNDKSYASLGLKAGDKVTLIGYRGSYGDKIEVMYAYYVSHEPGEGGGDETDYDQCEEKTVAQFIEAADKETYYKLSGTVSNFNSNYCSFDLTDDSGTIYVYSVDNKDEWKSKVANGGTIVLAGKYSYYEKEQKHEVVNAQILSFTPGEGGDEPGGEDEPGEQGDYASNVSWTLGANAYDDCIATVNGTPDVQVLKLGTSKAAGEAVLTIPKGTTKVSFYAVSWNGKPAKLVAKVGGSEIFSVEPAANSGAAQNSPFTLTVTSSDHYTKDLGGALESDTKVTVTTEGTNTRVILFGIKAE